MATKSNTEWGNYNFKITAHVQENDGKATNVAHNIHFETIKDNLKILGNGFLELQLRQKASLDEADQLAHMLNRLVEYVAYTHLED